MAGQPVLSHGGAAQATLQHFDPNPAPCRPRAHPRVADMTITGDSPCNATRPNHSLAAPRP